MLSSSNQFIELLGQSIWLVVIGGFLLLAVGGTIALLKTHADD